MEKARWKVRLCVITAVVTAIIVGVIYYVQFVRPMQLTEGILISIMSEIEEGQNTDGTK